MRIGRQQHRFGTLQRDLPLWKDVVDFQLTRFPGLYLFVERFREWGNWDKRVYLSFVRRGDIALDVGANVGAHAVFLSHMVGSAGRVLAFEPLAPNLAEIEKTLERRARIPNIEVFPLAVGNPRSDTEIVTIKVPGADLTQASLRRQESGSWAGQVEVIEHRVKLTSLDTHPAVASLARLDFVKIDVEGGELDVLKGGVSTLSTHLPLLYCEVFEKWTTTFGYAAGDLFRFARSLGYIGGRLISSGKVHRLALDEPPDGNLFRLSSDVLFFSHKHKALISGFDHRYLA